MSDGRVIKLVSGGILTFSANINYFALTVEDRAFLAALVDIIDKYEEECPPPSVVVTHKAAGSTLSQGEVDELTAAGWKVCGDGPSAPDPWPKTGIAAAMMHGAPAAGASTPTLTSEVNYGTEDDRPRCNTCGNPLMDHWRGMPCIQTPPPAAGASACECAALRAENERLIGQRDIAQRQRKTAMDHADDALRVRDLARESSQRDLEAKRAAEAELAAVLAKHREGR